MRFIQRVVFLFLVFPGLCAAHASQSQTVINTVEFKDTDVRDAVRLISEQSGMNIVVTNEASTKKATLFLQKVRAEDVLATLCKVAGLWYRKDISSSVYRVMTTKEYVEDITVFQNYQTRVYTLNFFNGRGIVEVLSSIYGNRVFVTMGSAIESFTFEQASNTSQSASGNNQSNNGTDNGLTQQANQNSTGTSRQPPSNGNPKTSDLAPEVVQQLADTLDGGSVLSVEALNQYSGDESPIYVTLNQEHNQVIVRASDARIFEDIDGLITSLDKPVPQVLLEMKILSLGVDDSFRSLFNYARSTSNKQLGLGNFPLKGGTLTYQFISDKILSGIELSKTNNNTRLLSAPVVMASNHRPARMFVGEEVVLTRGADRETITPNDGPSRDIITLETEIRDVGTILEVVPRINQDKTITLAVRQESSSLSPNAKTITVAGSTDSGGVEIALDTVVTTELEGTIIAKDGLAVAVGGLFRKNRINEQTKVPLLGDIPMLGRLFRKEISRDEVTELVLLITPHVVHDAKDLDIAHLNKVVARNKKNPRDSVDQLTVVNKEKMKEKN